MSRIATGTRNDEANIKFDSYFTLPVKTDSVIYYFENFFALRPTSNSEGHSLFVEYKDGSYQLEISVGYAIY